MLRNDTTYALSEFAAEHSSFPPALFSVSKLHIADTIACILAGASEDATRIAGSIASLRSGSAPRIPIPGYGYVNDPAGAALVLGVAAHVADYDDTSEFGMGGHPSAPTLAALLAVDADVDLTGRDLIEAFAIGVEVACKIGRVIGKTHAARGWHNISTVGAIAAAAACARARRLSTAQTETAVGIAASFSGGLIGNFGTMTKSLHCGHAAWTGYVASALARNGFEASTGIMERKDGFIALFADSDKLNQDAVEELGQPWDLLEPGVSLKMYPSCNCTHLAVDGALDIVRNESIPIEQIRRVRCWTRELCLKFLVCKHPADPLQAKFSMEYCVAAALVRGDLSLTAFSQESVDDPAIGALLDKVDLLVRADNGGEPDIQIELSDGQTIARRSAYPRGSRKNPVGWAGFADKFVNCTSSLTRSQVISTLDMLRTLEQHNNISRRLAAMTLPA